MSAVQEAAENLGPTPLSRRLSTWVNPPWTSVPERVWNTYIGAYQVIKKWLSYREKPLLGRPLNLDEAREITNLACRLPAVVLIEPALDANFQAVKRSTYSWPKT